ncbi:MAG: c-type cytochrome [Bacteroidetes bacterium]|nr:MAG: c-type cytochrome [Bacteroidota bacterium]
MKRQFAAIVCFIIITGFAAKNLYMPATYDPSTPVSSILLALGDEAPAHYVGTVNMDKVRLGKDIIHLGGPWENGVAEYRVSKHFVCTDCHNTQPESKFADDNDPDSRLKHSKEFNLPYLPGSTFYGITNRTSWFNGDHEKKYGKELIEPARHDLRNAIQLCSKECSVGRVLTDEEMEAVLSYLSTMELKLRDLNLSDDELERISANNQTDEQKSANIQLIKSKYLSGYPATFVEELPKKERKMGVEGDMNNGKWIYEKSCLHCHAPDKTVTDRTIFGSAEGQKDFRWLASYFKKSNGGSIYWITRHGTQSKEHIPQYMPIYSAEKLSNSQIEDLAAYILSESKK